MQVKNSILLGTSFLFIVFLSWQVHKENNKIISATAQPERNSLSVEKKDTHVLLTVDTRNINEDNKNSKVFFTDDRSDPSENPGNPEQFVSKVDRNMKIYWSGEAKMEGSNNSIDILEVYRKPEGGAEILEKTFRDPNKDGIIIGKIKNKKVSGFENYSIVFRIKGDTIKTFTIDPKLQMTETN